ncbi:winged helix-turn-helix domain-containing protein [Streptomyces exfoliatus]|uniref:winged helix-turn-helix domain-containing protein n=1 Tax=Streptomyces exfoliatus TaxID=1905 RepID=UPI003CCC2DFA
MGRSPQVPAHRAVERDEQAVARWRAEQWSRVRERSVLARMFGHRVSVSTAQNRPTPP